MTEPNPSLDDIRNGLKRAAEDLATIQKLCRNAADTREQHWLQHRQEIAESLQAIERAKEVLRQCLSGAPQCPNGS